jgi:predicted nucleic acid-binding protein
MITADTSTWIAFFKGERGRDVELLDQGLRDRQIVMVPAVLAELFSDPKLPAEIADTLAQIPMIEVQPGYWHRAGHLRAKVLSMRRKARLGDALIAQSCIDARLALITRDADFKAFVNAAGIDLIYD